MLTIAIVCGAGIATSALIADQVRDHLASRGRGARSSDPHLRSGR